MLTSGNSRQVLFLTGRQWALASLVSVALAVITLWFTFGISVWLGLTVGLAVLVIFHLAFAPHFIVALPHIAILIACLQYVFAAWLNFYWPPSDPTYDIGVRFPIYLSYAGPLLLALTVGWAFGLVKLRPPHNPPPPANSSLLIELDVLFGVGIASFWGARLVNIQNLAFVFLLFGNLRYVGVFGRMLYKGNGWRWRLALLLGTEASLAAGSTMFHDLLLWSAWAFAVWIYTFKPGPRTIIAAVAAGALFLPAFQEAKWRLRDSPLEDDPLMADEMLTTHAHTRVGAWLSYLIPSLQHTLTGSFDEEFLADVAVRYNQGWIVNRVMMFVPEVEPYAEGSTLRDAAIAALLPRVFAPGKFVAGGAEHMAQYAGIQLNEQTAMTLGFAGEMYANFGLIGGVIGCGLYALFFGLIFRAFCHRAFTHPLWWSLVPFIFYPAIKAEDDVAFVLNWTVKACVLLAGVLVFLPNFRHALFGRLTAAAFGSVPRLAESERIAMTR